MKKVLALLSIVALVSCGGSADTKAPKADTTKKVESAKVAVDTTKKAIDSTKK